MNEKHLIYDVHSPLSTSHSVLLSYCIASVTRRHTSIQRASQLCIRDYKPTAHLHSEVPHHQHERLAALYSTTLGSPNGHTSRRAQFRISLFLPFLLGFVLGWRYVLFSFSSLSMHHGIWSLRASAIGRTRGTWRFYDSRMVSGRFCVQIRI